MTCPLCAGLIHHHTITHMDSPRPGQVRWTTTTRAEHDCEQLTAEGFTALVEAMRTAKN